MTRSKVSGSERLNVGEQKRLLEVALAAEKTTIMTMMVQSISMGQWAQEKEATYHREAVSTTAPAAPVDVERDARDRERSAPRL